VSLRVGLDVVKKRKSSCTYQETNADNLVARPQPRRKKILCFFNSQCFYCNIVFVYDIIRYLGTTLSHRAFEFKKQHNPRCPSFAVHKRCFKETRFLFFTPGCYCNSAKYYTLNLENKIDYGHYTIGFSIGLLVIKYHIDKLFSLLSENKKIQRNV
jgi:hypothetical protein